MQLEIIKLSPNQVEQFYPTFKRSILEDFVEYTSKTRDFILKKEFSKAKIKNGLREEIFTILVAKINQKVVGFAFGSNWNGGVSSLYWLGVLSEERNKGVASQLLKNFEIEMKNLGIHNIEIRSPERNLQFYKNRGYTLTGLIRKTFFGVDDWFFYKIIQEPKEENYLKEPINYSI